MTEVSREIRRWGVVALLFAHPPLAHRPHFFARGRIQIPIARHGLVGQDAPPDHPVVLTCTTSSDLGLSRTRVT